MSITIEAVYQAGILKPLTPLPSLAENAKVRLTIEPSDQPLPRVRRTDRVVDHSREGDWLKAHRDEYRGQWIVLDGDRLVGHTANAKALKAIFDQARAEGVYAPFVKLIPLDDEPIWTGLI